MKKIIVGLFTLLCAAAALAQPSKMAVSGASNYLSQAITFGGNNYLTLSTGKDTLSDPIVVEISTIRPGQMMAIEYFAIAADSTTSGYKLFLESRVCTNPALSQGCPNKWLKPRFRRVYDSDHFADTAWVTVIPSNDTSSVSHTTLVPTGNQMRLRVKATTATSDYFRGFVLRGY